MSYNLLNPVHIITAGDMSGSITSSAVEVKLQDNVGVQLHWTGTPTGTFAIQVSMDHREDIEGNIVVAGHWVSLILNPTVSAAGSADDAYVDLNQLSAMYIRIVYTASGGSGTLDAFINAKGV